MANSGSRDALRRAHITDKHLHLPTYNGMVDYVKARGVPPQVGALMDQFGSVVRDVIRPQRELWWPCVSDDAIDPFGIVEVYDAQPGGKGFYFSVRKATSGAKLFAGNEDYKLFAKDVETGEKGFGWIKLITPFEPVTIRTTSDEGDITFLDDLKVIAGQQVAVLSGSKTGLVALTKPEAETGKIGVIFKDLVTASSDSFLAVLTDKDYVSDDYITYSWVKVTSENYPGRPVTYEKTDTFGCLGNMPAYHWSNFDHPVQQGLFGLTNYQCSISEYYGDIDGWAVVRMWKGNGDFYLFGDHPHSDLFYRTGETDDDGEIGFEWVYDQELQGFRQGREVRIISA